MKWLVWAVVFLIVVLTIVFHVFRSEWRKLKERR